MSVVVNVMLSNNCNVLTHCLVHPISAHMCEVMYFGSFCFRVGFFPRIVMISACVL